MCKLNQCCEFITTTIILGARQQAVENLLSEIPLYQLPTEYLTDHRIMQISRGVSKIRSNILG